MAIYPHGKERGVGGVDIRKNQVNRRILCTLFIFHQRAPPHVNGWLRLRLVAYSDTSDARMLALLYSTRYLCGTGRYKAILAGCIHRTTVNQDPRLAMNLPLAVLIPCEQINSDGEIHEAGSGSSVEVFSASFRVRGMCDENRCFVPCLVLLFLFSSFLFFSFAFPLFEAISSEGPPVAPYASRLFPWAYII